MYFSFNQNGWFVSIFHVFTFKRKKETKYEVYEINTATMALKS